MDKQASKVQEVEDDSDLLGTYTEDAMMHEHWCALAENLNKETGQSRS